MFPHEEFLQKALEECSMTKLVQDLGDLYVSLCLKQNVTDAWLQKVLKVNKILDKAASDIADLGDVEPIGIPRIVHPLDGQPND